MIELRVNYQMPYEIVLCQARKRKKNGELGSNKGEGM